MRDAAETGIAGQPQVQMCEMDAVGVRISASSWTSSVQLPDDLDLSSFTVARVFWGSANALFWQPLQQRKTG